MGWAWAAWRLTQPGRTCKPKSLPDGTLAILAQRAVRLGIVHKPGRSGGSWPSPVVGWPGSPGPKLQCACRALGIDLLAASEAHQFIVQGVEEAVKQPELPADDVLLSAPSSHGLVDQVIR